ncbi:hypothetical protein ATO49_14680 [Mycolicibacterium fortuitum subsp. fortuitum DSM 46621 = ATCC 6841 = JCM 6387]|nr:hypothetical protein ATO49_14680 [Mycolicibacterium fortuitum subsp. fortuitum DSM 46621 = ATCC 6841 = JCM 6387]
MSGIGTEDVPGHWLTASEIARASRLREDLVERFLPAGQPQSNLYGRDLVAVARFVKVLTDLGTRPQLSKSLSPNSGLARTPPSPWRCGPAEVPGIGRWHRS